MLTQKFLAGMFNRYTCFITLWTGILIIKDTDWIDIYVADIWLVFHKFKLVITPQQRFDHRDTAWTHMRLLIKPQNVILQSKLRNV